MRIRRAPWAAILALCLLPAGAGANTITVGRSIEVPGEDGYGLVANIQAVFNFDGACDPSVTTCSLEITLRYLESGELTKAGQALTGLTFEPLGSAIFTDATGAAALSGGAEFVGTGASQAGSDLGNDVSPHWGLKVNLAFSRDLGLGSILLSSVGDITFGSQTASGMGTPHLFASPPSSVELNPPDGIDFALVDPDTCTTENCPTNSLGSNPDNLRAYIRNELTATLSYTGGLLTGIDKSQVNFLFGTDGNLVPEPSTALLLAGGLAGLALARRRRSQD